MSQSESSRASDTPDFVLKHRITGAAVLLFFGALVLPWILGAPGGADAVADTASVPSSSDEAAANADVSGVNNSVANLAQALAEETAQVEEQVYISRITPLDAEAESSALGANTPAASSSSPTSSPTTSSSSTAKGSGDAPAATQNTVKTTPDSSGANTSKSQQSAAPTVMPKVADTKAAPTRAETVRPAPKAPAVDVGWVVQVGVFTDQRGAKRVVEDLRSKGFSPSTTIVDTNRGKATGTRIWLGPYAQRVDAAKAKSELTEKTGEAGFIRAYP